MTVSDWINVSALFLGLVLIFVAGFMSGRLWQRGEYVRLVMTGEEPPPWDPEPTYVPDRWTGGYEAGFRVRRGPYDWYEEN